MSLTHNKLRILFSQYLEKSGHSLAPPISLIPQNDPTTLFTGSGMQQFMPYFFGEKHPLGNRLYNIQKCIRVQDIEEVGDNRHDTLFEMMGNWSFGDYFKEEQLASCFEFLTDKKSGLGLDPNKLFVTVFEGGNDIPRDDVSIEIWTNIFKNFGIKPTIGDRIWRYGTKSNWWSRAGSPENMPPGEPGGPSSEIFYQFDTKHDPIYGSICNPNCECGKYLEIGNSVFMEYKKKTNGQFELLPKKNVDFGGGLERVLAAANNDPDIFNTDVFSGIIKNIEIATNRQYSDIKYKSAIRIIADHFKTSVFIIKEGIYPANKEHGYVLRRLLRRALIKIKFLNDSFSINLIEPIVKSILTTYEGIYFNSFDDLKNITPVIQEEIEKFQKTLNRGLVEINKYPNIDAKIAFDLYQSYGIPFETTKEIVARKGIILNNDDYDLEVQKHKDKSRSSAKNRFAGGLADKSDQTIKYHTATHLLHQALFEVLGKTITQAGSNITASRLRFDFQSNRPPTQEEIDKVQSILNQAIEKKLEVWGKSMKKEEAYKVGAKAFFREKYPEVVNVYFIGKDKNDSSNVYSIEFCGGPHVSNTKEIGEIKIENFKKIGANLYRIYAK